MHFTRRGFLAQSAGVALLSGVSRHSAWAADAEWVPKNIGPYMEFPWRKPHRPAGWYTPDFVVRSGVVKVPEGPGLGVEIDEDFLRKAITITV